MSEDRCDLLCLDQRAAENLVSHHLRAPRTAGLADYRRDGELALYSLTEQSRALLDMLMAQAAP